MDTVQDRFKLPVIAEREFDYSGVRVSEVVTKTDDSSVFKFAWCRAPILNTSVGGFWNPVVHVDVPASRLKDPATLPKSFERQLQYAFDKYWANPVPTTEEFRWPAD